MHPKDKILPQLCQDVVCQWTCLEENCISSYIEESSRCLESRIKEHNTSATSTIFQHNSTHNHSKVDISQLKIIDQDRKQVSREARETMHIRRNNPALNCNIGKMRMPRIFNQILSITNSTSTDISRSPNIPWNPSTKSSSRASRALNLLNWSVHPHFNHFSHIPNVLVQPHYNYTHLTHMLVLS